MIELPLLTLVTNNYDDNNVFLQWSLSTEMLKVSFFCRWHSELVRLGDTGRRSRQKARHGVRASSGCHLHAVLHPFTELRKFCGISLHQRSTVSSMSLLSVKCIEKDRNKTHAVSTPDFPFVS